MQIRRHEANCLPCFSPIKNYDTKGRTVDPWPFPLFPQLQAKWVFGNMLSDLLHCCNATLWRRNHLEGRECIWERGAYGDVGFAGGKLVVKIGKVKIAGKAEGREASMMMSAIFVLTWVMSEARCSSRQSAAASSDPVEEW